MEAECDRTSVAQHELDFPIVAEAGLLVLIGNCESDLLLLVDADSAVLTGSWR